MLSPDQPKQFHKPRWVSDSLADYLIVGLVMVAEAIENLPFVQRRPWIKRAFCAVFDFGTFLRFLLFCLAASHFYRLANDPQSTPLHWVVGILFYSSLLAPTFTKNPKILLLCRTFLWCFFGFIIARILYFLAIGIQDYFSTHAWWEPLPDIAWWLWFGLILWATCTTIDRLKCLQLLRVWRLLIMLAVLIIATALMFGPIMIVPDRWRSNSQ